MEETPYIVGDRVSPRSYPGRYGTVEALVHRDGPALFLVRWDDIVEAVVEQAGDLMLA